MIFSTYEAKARFSELLSLVEAGFEVTVTKRGTPVARLVPMNPQQQHDEGKKTP